MSDTYARFKIGDACLYQGKRYMITSPVWVDPFPGYFTWQIEHLLDANDPLIDPPIRTLEWVIENGIIDIREGQRYQVRNVGEDELTDVDAPPTWDLVDELRARIQTLETALRTKYRRTGIVPSTRPTGDAS